METEREIETRKKKESIITDTEACRAGVLLPSLFGHLNETRWIEMGLIQRLIMNTI